MNHLGSAQQNKYPVQWLKQTFQLYTSINKRNTRRVHNLYVQPTHFAMSLLNVNQFFFNQKKPYSHQSAHNFPPCSE